MKNSIKGLALCLLLTACAPKNKAQSNTSPENTTSWPVFEPSTLSPESPEYKGYELMKNTSVYLAEGTPLNLAKSEASCKSCHLKEGREQGAISFVGIAQRYPKYRAQLGREISLQERVNLCFQRSLNAKALPEDSPELQAMTAYLEWLSPKDKEQPELAADQIDLAALTLPEREPDLARGQGLYQYHCAACHAPGGNGRYKKASDKTQGYLFPPLWGDKAYTTGSSMARLSIATRYIKAKMPLGRPVLTLEEAYDLAGYINAQDRPHFAGSENDYPKPEERPNDLPQNQEKAKGLNS